jgi:ferredoxin--NADP+ reductase
LFEIIFKQEMAKGTIVRFDVKAPRIAEKVKAGQFVMVRVNEEGERIPLTVADVDRYAGTITLIIQVVGKTTALMRSLEAGDYIRDLAGPLGKPAEIGKIGTVIVVGGGTGVAILHHITKAFREADNYIIGIIGARDKDLLILKDEMGKLCDELVVTTDDGSFGLRGFVTQPLQKYLDERYDVKLVYAIGPVVMMRNVCDMTRKLGIKTMVSLNPVMVDGTGMCGGCRVMVDGEKKFCCSDGPDFDGHKVDFDSLLKRSQMYLKEEKASLLASITMKR